MKKLLLCILLLISLTINLSCSGKNTAVEKQIKNDYTKAMNSYQDIWQTKEMNKINTLAEKAFANKEIKKEIINIQKENINNDFGIKMTDKNYKIEITNYNQEEATVNVTANLKGYPISINTGQIKAEAKQDFSFGPHTFKMKKEQGVWKINDF